MLNSYADPFLTPGQQEQGQLKKNDVIKETRTRHAKLPYTGPSRVFPVFNFPFPCVEGEPLLMRETPAAEGILFQRPHKTGSTTMVGIVMRLAHNRAKHMNNLSNMSAAKCKHRSMHGTAHQYQYGRRDKTKSFLFSIIRDPTARVISQFFHFDVTAFLYEPTDVNFRNMARRITIMNYYFKELSTREYVTNETKPSELEFAKSMGYKGLDDYRAAIQSDQPGATRLLQRQFVASRVFGLNYDPVQVVKDILDDYNFIAIMERMDESLVVFQMLLGLTTKEILYTKARSSGSFSNGWPDRPCFYIMNSFLSPGMTEFFDSEEWKLTVANDMLMYQAANKSLDRTIESLDRFEFKRNMAALKRGLKLAQENCIGRVRTACSDGGDVIPISERTCYVWSEGCDHDCIDELEL